MALDYKGVDKASEQAAKAKESAPFLGQEGENFVDTTGGIWKGITGDSDGWKQAGKGIWNSLTAAGLRGLNTPPPQQFYGGSPEELARQRALYDAGMASGVQTMQGGMGTLGAAAGQTVADRAAALGMYGQGASIGQSGLASQDANIVGMVGAAYEPTSSAARALMAQGVNETANQMRATAADARGGNQAAAMRNANAQGAQMISDMSNRAAQLRAQEENARRAQIIGAQQAAAGFGANQASLGYGMQGQALNLAGQSTGQLGSLGSTQGQLGLGQQELYTGARQKVDEKQLEADTAWASAKKASQGGIMGLAGNVIGGLFGG